MKACKRLGLSADALKDFPESIEQIPGLESIDLYHNEIRTLSVHFESLGHLKEVYVKDSGIPSPEIEQLRKGFTNIDFSDELPQELYFQLH